MKCQVCGFDDKGTGGAHACASPENLATLKGMHEVMIIDEEKLIVIAAKIVGIRGTPNIHGIRVSTARGDDGYEHWNPRTCDDAAFLLLVQAEKLYGSSFWNKVIEKRNFYEYKINACAATREAILLAAADLYEEGMKLGLL